MLPPSHSVLAAMRAAARPAPRRRMFCFETFNNGARGIRSANASTSVRRIVKLFS